jgi:hypothetical protein
VEQILSILIRDLYILLRPSNHDVYGATHTPHVIEHAVERRGVEKNPTYCKRRRNGGSGGTDLGICFGFQKA